MCNWLIIELANQHIYILTPCSLISFTTWKRPFLFIVRIASVDNFKVIHLSSSARKYLFFCRLGKNRLRVFIFECDTVLPVIGLFPVTWHTLAIMIFFSEGKGNKENITWKIINGLFFRFLSWSWHNAWIFCNNQHRHALCNYS